MNKSDRGSSRSSGRVTGAQVAREAGVDPAIVSRIMRNDPTVRISEGTRTRVLEVVARLGYRPNFAAQRLRSNQISAIGLVIPDFRNPAFGEVVHGAEQASHELGVSLFAASPPDGRTNFDIVAEFIASQRVDGLLVAGGDTEETARINKYLMGTDVPYLFLNRKTTKRSRSLFLDDEYAVTLAVKHLVSLGHQDIGLVGGLSSMETARRRRKAFADAMKAARLPTHPEWITESQYSYRAGHDGLLRIMQTKQRPTAVVVAEFVSGIGALGAAQELELKVPEDLSLVVINNLEAANYTSPALTTVGLQLSAMGAEGVQLLLNKKATDPIKETISQPAQLFVRGSTCAPRKTSTRKVKPSR